MYPGSKWFVPQILGAPFWRFTIYQGRHFAKFYLWESYRDSTCVPGMLLRVCIAVQCTAALHAHTSSLPFRMWAICPLETSDGRDDDDRLQRRRLLSWAGSRLIVLASSTLHGVPRSGHSITLLVLVHAANKVTIERAAYLEALALHHENSSTGRHRGSCEYWNSVSSTSYELKSILMLLAGSLSWMTCLVSASPPIGFNRSYSPLAFCINNIVEFQNSRSLVMCRPVIQVQSKWGHTAALQAWKSFSMHLGEGMFGKPPGWPGDAWIPSPFFFKFFCHEARFFFFS